KFGGGKHEFVSDWNPVRLEVHNSRDWIDKDVHYNATRNADLDVILQQFFTEETSSIFHQSVPSELVSTEWSMVYALINSKTIKMVLVNPTAQLKVLAEAIASDQQFKLMYFKEYMANIFKRILAKCWTGLLEDNASMVGIEDWCLTGTMEVATVLARVKQANEASAVTTQKRLNT
ncbi:hypothetical protein SARC_13966, partial [Sphaeroforma arctica JP610]